MRPAWGFNGEETRIEIDGKSFYPQLEVAGKDRFEFDHQFRVVLETDPETELTDVELLDYRHIEATVPAGLDLGTWGVRVETPTGATAGLDGAFEVRDTRADELRVTPADGQLSWQVLEFTATLTVELVDPDGNRVAEDLDITVSVDTVGEGVLEFQADTLDNQQRLTEGVGISGGLGPDGAATVALTSTEALEYVLLRVLPTDPESSITGTIQVLSFTPGEVDSLEIDLPSPVFDTTAGTSFDIDVKVVDVSGNVVEGTNVVLVLQEACPGGTLSETISFVGQATSVPVAVTGATGDGCDSNAIVATGFAGSGVVEGQSNLFEVAPAPAEGLDLDVFPDEVVAGEDEVVVSVTAVDEWSNRALDVDGALTLEASADGGEVEEPSWWICYDLVQGESYCRAVLDRAGDAVVVLVSTMGPGAVSGVSQGITVNSGAAVELDVAIDEDEVEAGEELNVQVQAFDALGNAVSLDPLGADVATFSTPGGDLVCDWDATEADGRTERYVCSFTLAGTGRTLEVEMPSRGLSAVSSPVDVVNAGLGLVSVDLSTTSVQAGQALSVQLSGTDIFGNAYVVQDDPVVALADDTGTISPTSVALGADGTAAVSVTITATDEDDQLVVSQDGVELGRSRSFAVTPGDAVSLSVETERTFAWVDQELAVLVQAIDSHGNVATGYTGSVTLSSAGALGDDVDLGPLVDGTSNSDFTWHSVGLADDLTASDGSLSASVSVDVVDNGCVSPPTADLTVAGSSPAVLCRLDSTGATRAVSLSAAGSVAGAAPLNSYHFRDQDGLWTARSSDALSTSWETVGGRSLAVVVVDSDACADVAEVDVYVADDDGTPAGPVSIVLADAELSAGSSTSAAETTASVSATDCAGDPAADGELLVRADLGAVEVAGAVITTGKGLQLTLDALGEGEVVWSMTDEVYGGTGTLMLGLADAVAYGEETVSVVNDQVRPKVRALAPQGTTSALFDTVSVSLTETLYEATVTSSNVAIYDPDGLALDLDDEDIVLASETLTISLPEMADGAAGVWTVELSSALRDADGNRLDGTWTGAAAAFSIDLGDVGDSSPDLTSCSIDTAVIRPDGDDGVGDEVEEVTLTAGATSAPDWWRLVVVDDAGTRVDTRWQPGDGGASATLTWDGRAVDGPIGLNGVYTLTVSPADNTWNTGVSCTATVAIDNRVQAP